LPIESDKLPSDAEPALDAEEATLSAIDGMAAASPSVSTMSDVGLEIIGTPGMKLGAA
jgi:hypothetical protein